MNLDLDIQDGFQDGRLIMYSYIYVLNAGIFMDASKVYVWVIIFRFVLYIFAWVVAVLRYLKVNLVSQGNTFGG